MLVAVEGCCHGMLNNIYKQISLLPEKPDLLLICGDFQSLRDPRDLHSLAVPAKYRQMGDFSEYYYQRKKAPILTVFVGGNHEASNYLMELPYGGWVAPNIYYMGKSNVLTFNGLTIGGISGIYNPINFMKPSFETVPLDSSTIRSVYHVRKLDFLKMLVYDRLSPCKIDIMMSHDWPQDAAKQGDLNKLLKLKPFFKRDIASGKLGSPINKCLLNVIRPKYWISAHLHVKYEASYEFEDSEVKSNQNEEKHHEIEVNLDSSDDDQEFEMSQPKNSTTKFIALDKCLPKRKFLEVISIDSNKIQDNAGFSYDPIFLAINVFFDSIESMGSYQRITMLDLLSANSINLDLLLNEICENVKKNMVSAGELSIPDNFSDSFNPKGSSINSQTKQYCDMIGIGSPH